MPRRKFIDFLRDIRDASNDALEFTRGMDFPSFEKDKRTVFAVVRALEIIGEAARQAPVAVQARYSDVPWRDMLDMRNNVIHEYFGVDVEVVWRTVQKDLPPLRTAISKILADLESGEGDG